MNAVLLLVALAVWLVALAAVAAIGYVAIFAARWLESLRWPEDATGAVPGPRHTE
ncbi:hypothetical protein O7599_27755 [Streptomyces sp. WMMC500]|uniref:hypothetical protein n=1 Tax=Streptomyces sp. WMMC500 TaxID=3015154 RepID=UPI00248D062A|nr:hypothetical protein [Streptomyces sp. WMMC500]WBB59341.1 hypothetical protein O7599_27755 [Streptomyces sp. WMMC500]